MLGQPTAESATKPLLGICGLVAGSRATSMCVGSTQDRERQVAVTSLPCLQARQAPIRAAAALHAHFWKTPSAI